MFFHIPATTKRVELNTCKGSNMKIKEKILENIAEYSHMGDEEIKSRIEELNKEWDIDRVLETNAAIVILLSTILGIKVDKKWFLVSGITGGFLFEHAIKGWCPPLPFFRKLGVRTSAEINYEKQALRNLMKNH